MRTHARSIALLSLLTACSQGSPANEATVSERPLAAQPDASAPPSPASPAAAQRAPEGEGSTQNEGALVREVLALGPDASLSVGSPTEGQLQRAVALPLRGPGFRFNPSKNPQARHGTVELVQALVRAAAAVEREVPGDVLTINDLSMPRGGDIPGHASHRSGRDVDVLFYLVDAHGKPFPSKAIPLEPDGTGTDYADLADPSDDVPVRIDVARTWAFVQALVLDPNVDLQRILVVEHLRAMLLEHARKVGAPKRAMERFGALTCQPNFPHDDHFHIRVFCSPDDIAHGCLDTAPIYPWHRDKLAKQGVTPKLAGPRTTPRPKLKSVDEAKREAKRQYGEMHQDVLDFLERRKAWVKKPRPGRPYCK